MIIANHAPEIMNHAPCDLGVLKSCHAPRLAEAQRTSRATYFFIDRPATQINVFFQNNFMRKSWVTKNYLTEVPKYRFVFSLKGSRGQK